MSEEQLKQLNERLVKAEQLLDKAYTQITTYAFFSGIDWLSKYKEYLQTYKK